MNRRQLVELEDLPWFPAILRDGGTAFLAFGAKAAGHGKLFAPKLAAAIAATGAKRMIDLCSGGGGPARLVADALAEGGHRVELVLTDRFPNPKAFAFASEGSEGRVTGRAASVDATDVPPDLVGFRTIYNAFHHFPPELARRILADAVAKRQPIAIFEAVSREPLMLLALLFSPLSVTLTMPLWRPFRWPWLLFTWIFPVMQPFVLWDGVVSWLRIYSVEELRALVATIDAPDWEWDIGTLQHAGAPLHATYLIGTPKALPGNV